MKSGNHPTSAVTNNPYHMTQSDLPLSFVQTGAIGVLKHEIDDLVKLELTAEQMLGEEVDLAKAYISDDIHGVWTDISGGLSQWELIAGEWLLSAADPTRVDWQMHHWWGDEESQFRH